MVVFVTNLKDLLLVALVGIWMMLGLDFGFWIGVKVVVVDDIGKVVDTCVIFLYQF
ncbi:MAG: hypothetical protein O7C59_08180 [Rickettsia endosymbiont of Ixodes persulcatus]|nr:hypothetical protein [Rickettsia endosymbiont of Ixodes persulcatus]